MNENKTPLDAAIAVVEVALDGAPDEYAELLHDAWGSLRTIQAAAEHLDFTPCLEGGPLHTTRDPLTALASACLLKVGGNDYRESPVYVNDLLPAGERPGVVTVLVDDDDPGPDAPHRAAREAVAA